MIWAKEGLIGLKLLSFVFALGRGAVRIPRFSMACVILVLPTISSAYMRGYLPLDDAELARRFHQQQIPMTFNVGATARFRNALIRLEEDGQLVITGRDAVGLEWRVTSHWNAFGGAFYSADLDHNGKPDLIFAWNTGGNGLAPSMHIVTLMFDRDDRPIPCEMDGYFEIDTNGVKDLVDLDGDGRAELIRQAYDDGYWITSVYEARDARWHLVKGAHGNRGFPLYTRFTNRPNRVPTVPMPGRHPVEDDLSNDSPLYSSGLRGVKWADVAVSENPELILSDGTTCRPIAWYSSMTVILDTKSGRVAATLSAPEEARRLVEKIRDAKVPIQIMGRRRYAVAGDAIRKPTPCTPEAVWATEP
jgi:hypothetical protein